MRTSGSCPEFQNPRISKSLLFRFEEMVSAGLWLKRPVAGPEAIPLTPPLPSPVPGRGECRIETCSPSNFTLFSPAGHRSVKNTCLPRRQQATEAMMTHDLRSVTLTYSQAHPAKNCQGLGSSEEKALLPVGGVLISWELCDPKPHLLIKLN